MTNQTKLTFLTKNAFLVLQFIGAIYMAIQGTIKSISGELMAMVFLSITILLLLIVSMKNHVKSRYCSYIICISSIVFLLVFSIKGYTNHQRHEDADLIYINLSFAAVSLVVFLLENMSTKKVETRPNHVTEGKESPEYYVSFLKSVTFVWMHDLAFLLYKKLDATIDDLYAIPYHLTVEKCRAKLERYWDLELAKEKPSLIKALAFTYKPYMILTSSIKSFGFCLRLFTPIVTGFMVTFVEARGTINEQPLETGLMVVIFYTLIMFTSAIITGQLYHYSFMAQQVSSQACKSLIFKRCFSLSNDKQATTGHIITMIQGDVGNISMALNWAVPLIGDIIPTLIAFYMLYSKIGWYFVIIPLTTIVSIPVFASLSEKVQVASKGKLGQSDGRVTLLTDVLTGMKTIKMYGWSSIFKKKILGIRKVEIDHLKSLSLNSSIQLGIATFGTVLASFILFLVLGLTGNVQTPSVVFQLIQLIALVQIPISAAIDLYPMLLVAQTSVERMQALLLKKPMDEYVEHKSPDTDVAVSIVDGTFAYEETEILKSIQLQVPKGSFTAVIGKVGSGKSTLLHALLGEIIKVSGDVQVNGSVGYAAQTSWIMNQSIRENILFGDEMDEDKYKRVCLACDLYPDFQSLPNEDQTLVGPKGISLSGGQKARISLARALYSSSDVILLDDPLSAVDAHVEKHIVDSLFGNEGVLQGKTVVLVTHAIHHLDKMNQVILIEDGQITESGSYEEVMNLKGSVYNMVSEHLANQVENEEAKDTTDTTVADKEAMDLSKKEVAKTKEQRSSGTVDRGVYWYYVQCCGYIYFVVFLLLIVIQCTMSNGTFYALSAWGKSDSSTVWFYFAIYSALTFGVVFATFGNQVYFKCFLSIRAANIVFTQSLDKIFKLPMSFFNTTPVGQILQRVDLDQATVDNRLSDTIDQYLKVLINVIVVGITLLLPTIWMAVVLIISAILFYLVQIVSIPAMREVTRIYMLAAAPVNSLVTEVLDGMRTIRAFGKSKQLLQKADSLRDTHARAFYSLISTSRATMVMTLLISALITSAVPLVGVLVPAINPSLIGVAMINAGELSQFLSSMIRVYGFMETSMISLERIAAYSKLEEEAASDTDYPLEKSWPKNGSIQLENYSTTYAKDLDPVIKNLSVNIKGGEKVGIVGRTGAGKSSLTLSLFRLIEATSGRIVIDGVDISQIGLDPLRSRLSILPQDSVVFSGSVRDNLDPSGEIPDDVLWKALEASQMHEYVSELPEKLDSPLTGENGGLSHGQRQLLCLARAMIRNSSVSLTDLLMT
ncbi:P-loop containing nucleoside triphosphate hydrolase protein [Globomyces pollinis-pini]|nr:P-loop containing nucleoside triphosphate hydrolase protein [Globomyces pollinis-pini]